MRMTPMDYGEAVAGEVRAAMARKSKRIAELAEVLGVTPATAGRRFNGETPFDVIELMLVATWLEVPVEQLTCSTEAGAA